MLLGRSTGPMSQGPTSFFGDGKLESLTRYYDPLVGYKDDMSPQSGLNVAFLLVPQQRELATRIYDAAANALGWRTPGAQVRASAYGLIHAQRCSDRGWPAADQSSWTGLGRGRIGP